MAAAPLLAFGALLGTILGLFIQVASPGLGPDFAIAMAIVGCRSCAHPGCAHR